MLFNDTFVMIFMLHNLRHLLRGRTASKIHDSTTNLGFIVQATYLAASTQSEEFFILMFSSLNQNPHIFSNIYCFQSLFRRGICAGLNNAENGGLHLRPPDHLLLLVLLLGDIHWLPRLRVAETVGEVEHDVLEKCQKSAGTNIFQPG